MREHAIPQDVVGYRFHIIGNMTLKQFLEVGFGCVVGLGIYATNLPAFMKWPLIGLAVATGSMAAFVPFEERPLDHWIVTFFRVLYKPTQFFWKRTPSVPEPFLFKPESNQPLVQELDLTPARRQRIKEYIGSLDRRDADPYDEWEKQRVAGLLNMFDAVTSMQLSVNRTFSKPDLIVRPHSLKQRPDEVPTGTSDVSATPTEVVYEDQTTWQWYNGGALEKQQLEIAQVAQNLQIPETPEIKVQLTDEDLAVTTPQPGTDATAVATPSDDLIYQQTTLSQPTAYATQQVSLNANLPFPAPPTEPNKLVGMVLTANNDLINDTIVEIQDSSGVVARAVKTNALGQFFVTTPLPNGTYTLIPEREGYVFQPITINLDNTVVAPIEIRSLTS